MKKKYYHILSSKFFRQKGVEEQIVGVGISDQKIKKTR